MFEIMFIIVPIFVLVIWVFAIAMIFSPKLRAKFMGKQIKATKYMMDENEEDLRSIANKNADISKESIETTVRAIKRGITEDEVFCKYCGKSIDSDSKFCKNCGKEQ